MFVIEKNNITLKKWEVTEIKNKAVLFCNFRLYF